MKTLNDIGVIVAESIIALVGAVGIVTAIGQTTYAIGGPPCEEKKIPACDLFGLSCFWFDGYCAATSRKFSSAAVYPFISAVTPKLFSYFFWYYNFRHFE